MSPKDEPRALSAKTVSQIHERMDALADAVGGNSRALDLVDEIIWLLSSAQNVTREVAIAEAADALAEAERAVARGRST